MGLPMAYLSSGRQIIIYVFAVYISEAFGDRYIQICEKCTQDFVDEFCVFCVFTN